MGQSTVGGIAATAMIVGQGRSTADDLARRSQLSITVPVAGASRRRA